MRRGVCTCGLTTVYNYRYRYTVTVAGTYGRVYYGSTTARLARRTDFLLAAKLARRLVEVRSADERPAARRASC